MRRHLHEVGRTMVALVVQAIDALGYPNNQTHVLEQALDRLTGLINGELLGPLRHLKLEVIGESVLMSGVRLLPEPQELQAPEAALARLFQVQQLGGFIFAQPVTPLVLLRWLEALAQPFDRSLLSVTQRQALEGLMGAGIRWFEPRPAITRATEEARRLPTLAFAIETHARLLLAFRGLVAALQEGRSALHCRPTLGAAVRDLIDGSIANAEATLSTLALAGAREPDERWGESLATFTCAYSVLIGGLLGLRRPALWDLGTALLVAEAPAVVAASPTRDGSWVPPLRSVSRILEAGGSDPALATSVLCTVERSRPFSVQTGPAIHPFSRIGGVARNYALLTSPPPPRRRVDPKQAISILAAESPSHFDPLAIAALSTLLEAYGAFD